MSHSSALTSALLNAPSSAPLSCALAVMSKAPQAGASKTRLTPPLTAAEAAALSACFLRDTTDNIARVALSGRVAGVAVYTPVGAEAVFDSLLPEGFSLLAQRGEFFGDRLFHAAQDLLAIGYETLCLIDSDSPTLPAALLEQAVNALARAGDRVVLGPSLDGGYYLIGLKQVHRRLFADVDWSTARVLAQTIERAAEIELEVELLPAWYDVDDATSLGALCDEMFAAESDNSRNGHHHALLGYDAPHTRLYLAQLLAAERRARFWPHTPARAQAGSG